MENNTACVVYMFPVMPGLDTLWLHMTYICQGLLIAGGNFIIVAAILRYEALRSTKEYLLMMGLSLADALNMTGFLFAGIYRMYLVLSGQWVSKVTAWQCMATPQNLLFSFSQHCASMMLSVISLDRLICVSAPLYYIGLSHRYVRNMILLVYAYSILTGAWGIAGTWPTHDLEPDIDARCVTSSPLNDQVVGEVYAWHYKYVPTMFGFASVVLYIGVWAQYKRQLHLTSDQVHNEEQLKSQRRMTKSLGICCICTFCLYCIPYSLAQVFNGLGYRSLPLFCWIVSNFNPLCNVFIYPLRHDEMKLALKGLFSGKHMPVDIRNWKNVANVAPMAKSDGSHRRPTRTGSKHQNVVMEQEL